MVRAGDKPAVAIVRERRDAVLDDGDVRYLDERASGAGTSARLGSSVDRPLLAGTQPDLYRCFMDRTWRSIGTNGVLGLIHPESHFAEARAGSLRRETYRRLRRHWQFRRQLKLLGDRALVCADPYIASTGTFAAAVNAMRTVGVEVVMDTGIAAELPVDRVHEAAERARGVAPRTGGFRRGQRARPGLVALLLTHGDPLSRYYGENQVPGPILPLVAVPTTAGRAPAPRSRRWLLSPIRAGS